MTAERRPSGRTDEVPGSDDAEATGREQTSPGLDRRRFLAAVASTALVAGCQFSGDETATPRTPRTADDIVTVTTSLPVTSTDLGPTLEPAPGRGHVLGFFHALVLPVDASTGEYRTSGHTWRLDDHDVSVPCLIREYRVADRTAELVFDGRHSYWNGEPLDARAYYLAERVRWLANLGAFDEETFGSVLVSDTEYHRALDDAAPNRFALRRHVHPGLPPLPPSYNEPRIERFESAGTEETVDDLWAEYYRGFLGLEEFVEEGYGSGAYEVSSTDDVRTEVFDTGAGMAANRNVAYAQSRESHPGTPAAERLRVLGGVSDGGGGGNPGSRSDVGLGGLVADGQVAFGSGVVGDPPSDLIADELPASVDQVGTFPNPVTPGRGLVFNWRDDHVRRLWVRRALVAAAPFDRAIDNVDGASSRPPGTHSAIHPRVDERVFDPEFRDALYDYPVAADVETAAGWLQRGGYERTDDGWVGPDGETLGITVVTQGEDDVTVAESIVGGWRSLGVDVSIDNLPGQRYERRIRGGDFHVAIGTFAGGWTATDFYGDWIEVGETFVATSAIATFGTPLETCRDDPLAAPPATVTLPSEPGALTIEGAEYGDGEATYRRPEAEGDDRSICEAVSTLDETGVDAEAYREAARICARWYNYALPNFQFACDREGVWADSEVLSTPSSEHRSVSLARGRPLAPEQYHLQAGTVRFDPG